MKQIHDVVYIPGLGDAKTGYQETVVNSWRLWGVRPHTFALRWADGENFEPKFRRLLSYIDNLLAKGHTVSLVAVSAGASAALNAYSARQTKITGVVLICGKINNPGNMNPRTFANNPAFKGSMDKLPESLARLNAGHRARIMSIHPLADHLVPIEDTLVDGAKEKTVISAGHVFTIATQLIFGAQRFLGFLKQI